jgi:hypothetical protein
MRTVVVYALVFIFAVAALPFAALGALFGLIGNLLDDAAMALHIYINPSVRRQYEKE